MNTYKYVFGFIIVLVIVLEFKDYMQGKFQSYS